MEMHNGPVSVSVVLRGKPKEFLALHNRIVRGSQFDENDEFSRGGNALYEMLLTHLGAAAEDGVVSGDDE